MRQLAVTFLVFVLFVFGAQAQEQGQFDQILLDEGLAPAAEYLDTLPQEPRTQFLRGAVETLMAIEFILQERYSSYAGQLPFVPGGRTILRTNPNAEFDPAFVEVALTGAIERLKTAQATLEQVAGKEFVAPVDLNNVWFDIDKDGIRTDDESISGFLGAAIDVKVMSFKLPVVKFDSADAYWLLAYVHVLQGMSEMVLSVDPTTAISKVWTGRQQMEAMGVVVRDPILGEENLIDTIAIVVTALHGKPEKARTQLALAHFKEMIAFNAAFWQTLEFETDNDAEWLPNSKQTSAFGVKVDAEMALGWQAVLGEMSAVLEGEALIPFWRVRASIDGASDTQVGVNFAKLMNDPGDFDLLLLVHGAALAPYLERGRVIDNSIFQRFSRLTGGQTGLFALWFN
ncbi:hypothetical protein [Maritalea sp.]|uniref:hypothetical protein n=1 Tax=Maritalea sp. TaxID=2003361 RepID=UPI003EF9B118